MFATTDPLGRNITLTTKTWNIHIVPGHNELYKQEKVVQRTVEDPEVILLNETNEQRQNYFRLCRLPGTDCISILKVVVDFSSSTGDVTTAYSMVSTGSQALTKRGVIYERP